MSFLKSAALVGCVLLAAAALRAAELAEADREFLIRYEHVRAALAADKLEDARKAAKELGAEGDGLAKSDQLASARAEFAKISERAIRLAYGRDGFYVVKCPMAQREWA